MKELGFLIDDRFLLHDPGDGHPESPGRLVAIKEALDEFGVPGRWRRLHPRPAGTEDLERIHSSGHVERIRRAAESAPARLDPDTAVSQESYTVARLAAGGVLECVDAAWNEGIRRSFAFVRPPGHHAEAGRAMGFCLFNNVAVAAAYLRRRHGCNRVAVVDIDLHHGNGTQSAFYRDPHVLYISSHQYPFYPGSGGSDETGAANGDGYTINFPLPAGTGDETLIPLYEKCVAGLLDQFEPEFILVSTGFDAYSGDPLGGLEATPRGYGGMAASLIRAADRNCGGRICFVLEGGYSRQGLIECTASVLTEMESDQPATLSMPGSPLLNRLIQEARRRLGGRWEL